MKPSEALQQIVNRVRSHPYKFNHLRVASRENAKHREFIIIPQSNISATPISTSGTIINELSIALEFILDSGPDDYRCITDAMDLCVSLRDWVMQSIPNINVYTGGLVVYVEDNLTVEQLDNKIFIGIPMRLTFGS